MGLNWLHSFCLYCTRVREACKRNVCWAHAPASPYTTFTLYEATNHTKQILSRLFTWYSHYTNNRYSHTLIWCSGAIYSPYRPNPFISSPDPHTIASYQPDTWISWIYQATHPTNQILSYSHLMLTLYQDVHHTNQIFPYPHLILTLYQDTHHTNQIRLYPHLKLTLPKLT